MSLIGDLQMQINILFFIVFLLVVFVAVGLLFAFRVTRQWMQKNEQLTNKITLLEEKLLSMEGKNDG